MGQKFRSKADLDLVAPPGAVTTREKQPLSNGRERKVGFYADTKPTVNEALLAEIEKAATPARPRRRRAAS